MKKKMMGIIAIVAIAAVAGYNVYVSQSNAKLSNLALNNIEALADDEHVAITQCFGKGSVDCPKSHRKVEYVFGGYSLEGLY